MPNTADVYNNLSKEQLIQIVCDLKGEISKLHDDFKKLTNFRLYHLERNQYMMMQYGRCESFEIVGIPESVSDDKLEDEVIDILKEAKVTVNSQPLKKVDISAVHRLRDKKRLLLEW